MRWEPTVGLVRSRRFGPKFIDFVVGDVGLVRWRRFGMWNETWDF
jgi:hypothetical protein